MNNKSKILSMILAASMSLSLLAGCSSTAASTDGRTVLRGRRGRRIYHRLCAQ